MLLVVCMALNELRAVQCPRIHRLLVADVTDLPLLFTTAVIIWQIQLYFLTSEYFSRRWEAEGPGLGCGSGSGDRLSLGILDRC